MNEEFTRQTQALVDTAVLGKQVEEFMQSDVGRHLAGRIDSDYGEAIKRLKDVDATDTKAVIAAQMSVRIPERMRTWLMETIAQGLEATGVLEDRQFEDDESEGM